MPHMHRIKIGNAKRWKETGMRPIFVSSLGFLFAFLLRQILTPILDDSLSMLLFTINCIVMSYLFGYVYSIVLLAISIPTSLFFFRKPYYLIDGLNRHDVFYIVVYVAVVLVSAIIIEWLQRERYSAVLQQRVSETRYRLLIESDQARRADYAEQFSNAGGRRAASGE
jgi:K+-sensing histidine kinase KdpD